jgi:uncharacterized membrane protein
MLTRPNYLRTKYYIGGKEKISGGLILVMKTPISFMPLLPVTTGITILHPSNLSKTLILLIIILKLQFFGVHLKGDLGRLRI